MLSSVNNAVSGVTASLKRYEVSAQNTANLSTEGFKKETVVQSEGGRGGVVVHLEKSESPGPQLPQPDGSLVEGSNVNLAEEAVEQKVASAGVSANLAVLKSTQEAEKSIIDIFA